MKWTELNELSQLDSIIEASHGQPQAIFKHSTRCIISRTVKRNFEAAMPDDHHGVAVHHLDLIAHRDISNAIAARTGVPHESPQLILIDKGEVVYHSSHQHIEASALRH